MTESAGINDVVLTVNAR